MLRPRAWHRVEVRFAHHRVDADRHAHRLGQHDVRPQRLRVDLDPRALDDLSRPEGARRVAKDLRVQFLPAEPGAFVASAQPGKRALGQALVLERVAGGDDDAVILLLALDQLQDQRHRSRRRRTEELGVLAEPQPEQELIVGLAIAPARDLLAERHVMLRPAQPVGLLGTETAKDGVVGETQFCKRAVVGAVPFAFPHQAFGDDVEQAGPPLETDAADVAMRGCHDRDLPAGVHRALIEAFLIDGACLAETTAGEQKPGVPIVTLRDDLLLPSHFEPLLARLQGRCDEAR